MSVVPGIDGSCSELAFHPAPSVVSIAQGGGGACYPEGPLGPEDRDMARAIELENKSFLAHEPPQ